MNSRCKYTVWNGCSPAAALTNARAHACTHMPTHMHTQPPLPVSHCLQGQHLPQTPRSHCPKETEKDLSDVSVIPP